MNQIKTDPLISDMYQFRKNLTYLIYAILFH